MNKKLVVFLDSIFERRKRERISFPDFEVQEYENEYFMCAACGQKHAKEHFFMPEKFSFSENGLIDLIQINYTPSPRGAHGIITNSVGDITDKKTRYTGWDSEPRNLYIPVESFYMERKNISVIAIKNENGNSVLYEGKKFLCDVSCGNGGTWTVLVSEELKPKEEIFKIFNRFLHRSCARNIAPSMWLDMAGNNRFLLDPPLEKENLGILEVNSFHNNGMDDEFVYENNSFFLGNDIVDKEELFIVTTYINSKKELTAIRCRDGKKFDVLLGDDDKLHYIRDDKEFSELETNYYLYNKRENENLEEV